MGAGASLSTETAKPSDASDLVDLASAKAEVQRLRRLLFLSTCPLAFQWDQRPLSAVATVPVWKDFYPSDNELLCAGFRDASVAEVKLPRGFTVALVCPSPALRRPPPAHRAPASRT